MDQASLQAPLGSQDPGLGLAEPGPENKEIRALYGTKDRGLNIANACLE